jgi:hypothetical protein
MAIPGIHIANISANGLGPRAARVLTHLGARKTGKILPDWLAKPAKSGGNVAKQTGQARMGAWI